jgi:antitoxin HicB
MSERKDLQYYLSLPYRIDVSEEDEGTWFARVAELPGCMTAADTAVEAVEMALDALIGWIEIALQDGQPIPEPKSKVSVT